MAVIESAEYGQRRRALAGSATIQAMAMSMNTADLPALGFVHSDGSPTFKFMQLSNAAYHDFRQEGDPEPGHIGAVAEALLMVLEEGQE